MIEQTDDRASDVHIVIRITVDLRFLLYARKTQTQCPQRWLVVYTPVARAVWPNRKPFHRSKGKAIIQRLTPSPSFNSVSKIRTLQTKVSCGTLVNPKLEALCRNGVPAGCPLFSGLQTGYCSLSPACRISLNALGEVLSLPNNFPPVMLSITTMRFAAHPLLLEGSYPTRLTVGTCSNHCRRARMGLLRS